MKLPNTNLREIFEQFYVAQNFKEIEWLSSKVKKIIENNTSQNKPSTILEIGVDAGGTFKIWEQLLILNNKGKENILIGIDISPNIQWDITKSEISTDIIVGNSHDIDTVKKVKKILFDSTKSDKFRKLDFVYIDGEHTPEAANKDFFRYGNLVRSGGAVGFHDVYDVGRFINLLDKNRLEIVKDIFPYDKLGQQKGIGTAFYRM